MIVLLGRQLISEAVLMALLVTKLSELGVEYQPCSTSNDDTNDRIVEWARLTTERTVDDNAKVYVYTNECGNSSSDQLSVHYIL